MTTNFPKMTRLSWDNCGDHKEWNLDRTILCRTREVEATANGLRRVVEVLQGGPKLASADPALTTASHR